MTSYGIRLEGVAVTGSQGSISSIALLEDIYSRRIFRIWNEDSIKEVYK